ncbi:MAG: hypothetical protein JJE46_01530 [Acidimicrobiia bacterium]|nr:hypothetical protein [Acidimicrobiia bacterium]
MSTAAFSLPRGSARAALVADGDHLALLGGFDSAKRTIAGVLRIDPVARTVADGGALPAAVHDTAGALIHGRPTAFGGGNGSETGTVQAVDAGGRGVTVGTLPIPRSDLATATIGDRTFIVGGYDGASVRASTLATTDGTTFQTLGDLPVPVRYPAVAAVGSEVYVIGGTTTGNADGAVRAVQILDTATGAVRRAGDLPMALTDAVAATVRGEIYVFGGIADGHGSNQVWRLDRPSTPTGATGLTPVATLPAPTSDAAVAVLHDTAYLVGGESPSILNTIVTLAVTPAAADRGSGPGGSGPGVDIYAHTRAGMIAPSLAGVPNLVYVPNSISNTVDVIDPATLSVIDHYPVGATPQHVVPSYDLSTLYVNNNRGNSLTPIDPKTGRPGPAIPVPDPYNLYFTPDGTRAIVMAERNSRVEFRDPKTWALVRSVPIPHSGVNHADFSPDGSIMIASCEFSGWLERINVDTMTVTGELNVGGMPVDVRSSPDGSVMYVANQGRNGVSVIDPYSMTEVGFIPTGKGTHGLYPSRDGTQLYATNRLAGSISVIDFATRKVVATWDIGGSPDMGGVSADGTRFWITGRYTGAVYVVDTTTGKLVARIPVGSGPHGLAVFPQPGRFSLGHTGNYR